jgi:acyl-CoA thioester hydrolase
MISIDHSVRVIYGHTDMMGRVYYGRYFEYFESARAHFLRELGLPYGEIEQSGIYIPVIESHCEYKHGATYDDLLTVRTMIRHVPKSRMKIEYDVVLDGDETLVATGHTVHTFMNRKGNAVRPPKQLLSLLNSRLNGHE